MSMPKTMFVRAAAGAVLLVSACASTVEGAATEHGCKLIATFQPGKLSRADVRAQIGLAPKSAERPGCGWDCWDRTDHLRLKEKAIATERATGKRVSAVDVYLVPEGLYSHAELWFVFDENELAIVAEALTGGAPLHLMSHAAEP